MRLPHPRDLALLAGLTARTLAGRAAQRVCLCCGTIPYPEAHQGEAWVCPTCLERVGGALGSGLLQWVAAKLGRPSSSREERGDGPKPGEGEGGPF